MNADRKHRSRFGYFGTVKNPQAYAKVYNPEADQRLVPNPDCKGGDMRTFLGGPSAGEFRIHDE
jgi:hypothetical protein